MAAQSRSRPARRCGSGGQVSKQQHVLPLAKADQPAQNLRNHQTHKFSFEPDDNEPPAKKRKLSIRSKQTALDNFTISQSEAPKPPTKVTLAQPRGQLVETINGVQNVLDGNVEDITGSTSRTGTPKPTTRVPQPELQRPSGPGKQEDKRTLRSQDDGPRLKSELAIYFNNYEDIIFDLPREPEFITVDTAIYITDDVPKQPKHEQTSPGKGAKGSKAASSHARKTSVNGIHHASPPQRSSSNHFNGSPSLSLDLISKTIPDNSDDPLTDEHFLKSHRRAERKEKQLRNIEKERAMHEKVQLERLLDGLQGHDWLKVLGITGITDGEAKKYESKRDYFIAEVQALVDKFKLWREQEKRQRLDKEAAAAAVEEADEEEESEEGSIGPPSSDLNASAARQLQQETVIALKSSATKPTNKGKESVPATPKPSVTFAIPSPEVPITSFYEKRHLRDAALGKARHGRNVTAFGHPFPELVDRDFELPEEIATEDALRANAREKRRRKRASIVDASSS